MKKVVGMGEKGIELGLGHPSFIDLSILKEENPKAYEKLKKEWGEYTGYDLDEYTENEPIIWTKEALEEEYLEIARESGVPENLLGYLDVEAMIKDDMDSGYLNTIIIDGIEYYYRCY